MINVTILILKLLISLFLDGDVPCSPSYGVYISQLVRFATASNHDADFNTQNKPLTQELLKQGYHYHTPRTRVCTIYRTPLGCYENLIISDLFIYPSRRSVS